VQHPFVQDLSDKTLEELQKSITELNTRLTFAYRTGNSALIHQVNMVMESYRMAYNKKMDELIQKQKINAKISIDKK
jgi:hypothetical protein